MITLSFEHRMVRTERYGMMRYNEKTKLQTISYHLLSTNHFLIPDTEVIMK